MSIVGRRAVAVCVVEIAGAIERAESDARVHLILAENARVIQVAVLVVFGQVLLIGATRERLQIGETRVIHRTRLVAYLDGQDLALATRLTLRLASTTLARVHGLFHVAAVVATEGLWLRRTTVACVVDVAVAVRVNHIRTLGIWF